LWHLPAIPALSRQKQEDLKFKASLNYTVRPCIQKKGGRERKKKSQIGIIHKKGKCMFKQVIITKTVLAMYTQRIDSHTLTRLILLTTVIL
jgi:hypothetical protein